MSNTEIVLQSKQAKAAILEGLVTWITSGDFQKGWNAMIMQGKKNLAYPALKIAIVLDILNGLSKK